MAAYSPFRKFDLNKFHSVDEPLFFKNDLIESEKNFEIVYKSIKDKTPFNVVTGIRPDVRMHLGYKFLANIINYFSRKGGSIYLINPKNEKILFGEAVTDKSLESTPLYNLLKYKDKLNIRIDSLGKDTNQLMLQIGSYYDIKTLMNKFNLTVSDSISKLLGLLYATSSYFIPNLERKTNYPTLVIGNKAHSSLILLANDFAKKSRLEKISSLFVKFIPGKDGSVKMSVSRESSNIYLDENIGISFNESLTIKDSNEIVKSQYKMNPKICTAMGIGSFFTPFKEINSLTHKCIKGNDCGSCKKVLLEYILKE